MQFFPGTSYEADVGLSRSKTGIHSETICSGGEVDEEYLATVEGCHIINGDLTIKGWESEFVRSASSHEIWSQISAAGRRYCFHSSGLCTLQLTVQSWILIDNWWITMVLIPHVGQDHAFTLPSALTFLASLWMTAFSLWPYLHFPEPPPHLENLHTVKRINGSLHIRNTTGLGNFDHLPELREVTVPEGNNCMLLTFHVVFIPIRRQLFSKLDHSISATAIEIVHNRGLTEIHMPNLQKVSCEADMRIVITNNPGLGMKDAMVNKWYSLADGKHHTRILYEDKTTIWDGNTYKSVNRTSKSFYESSSEIMELPLLLVNNERKL